MNKPQLTASQKKALFNISGGDVSKIMSIRHFEFSDRIYVKVIFDGFVAEYHIGKRGGLYDSL